MLRSHRLENRGKAPAGSAPRCPKIHNNKSVLLDRIFDIFFGQFQYSHAASLSGLYSSIFLGHSWNSKQENTLPDFSGRTAIQKGTAYL
jgi:hypothetical protein